MVYFATGKGLTCCEATSSIGKALS